MAQIGLDRALHPHLRADADARQSVARAEAAMAREPFRSKTRAPLVRLACLCADMPPHEIYDWLERLRLRRREQDVVAAAVRLGPLIAERLSAERPPPPSELHELLEGQPLELLVGAIALAPDPAGTGQRVAAYLVRVRGAALEITGDDLKRAGVPESPQIGAALRTTLALKLDGFVSGRDEELRTALRLIGHDRPGRARSEL
jgi:tRNA nucleotidyltransferase (CCA-adding enzyme)